MSDWGSWEPPKPPDEEPPESEHPAAEEPDANDSPWGSYPDWPAAGPSSTDQPVYGGYSTQDPVEEPPPPAPPTRDPLGRLFPGLSRGARVTLDWILTIAGAVLIVLALKHWVVNPYRIPSSSMEPYLNCSKYGPQSQGCLGDSSDRVLACRICLDFSDPARADVVVFNTPSRAATACGEGGTFVKRVIGLPGETVREDTKGYIWILHPGAKKFVRLDEPYISRRAHQLDASHYPDHQWKVPPGNYFMMGDNRSESCDSRQWGSVPRDDMIGTVFFVYWPPDRIGFK